MRVIQIVVMAMLLAACNSNAPPPAPPSGQFTCFKCSGMSLNDDGSFTFPNSSGVVGYIYRAFSPQQGQKITLNFALSGTGIVLPSPASGQGPAQLRLFLWRKDDDLSCAGPMASYRWWSNPGAAVLVSPSETSLSVTVDPALWTNCLGKHDPAGFQSALANLLGVGFTFGADFFGHGVFANGQVAFKVNSFTRQ